MQNNIVSTMRQFKIMDGSSFYPFNQAGSSSTAAAAGGGSIGEKFLERLHDHLRVNSIRSRSSQQIQNFQVDNSMLAEGLAVYGLPQKDLIEHDIEPYLKSVDFIESLADVYRRLESFPQFERSRVYVEQCALLGGLPDPKLCRRSLRFARQHAVDVHSKVVLSAALRYERREEELLGISSMECSGYIKWYFDS